MRRKNDLVPLLRTCGGVASYKRSHRIGLGPFLLESASTMPCLRDVIGDRTSEQLQFFTNNCRVRMHGCTTHTFRSVRCVVRASNKSSFWALLLPPQSNAVKELVWPPRLLLVLYRYSGHTFVQDPIYISPSLILSLVNIYDVFNL